jgi:NAD(P)-dependent dehydrogenase (short-subunit alcohol dehydrogenase family)
MNGVCVLITGATGGIGSELSRHVVAQGGRVVGMARGAERLEALAGELGSAFHPVAGDATSVEDLDRAVAMALDAAGRLDGLAHCLGSIVLRPLHLATPRDFQAALEVNLVSAFLACRAALGPMRRQGSGSIVLFSTVAARQGLNNHDVISAAKAGVEGMVRSAAITYARDGVRFNAVAPGLTDTPLAAPLLRNETSRRFSEAMHPVGRVGKPADVARVAAFLLDPESSWITGQVWGVDGGLGAGVAPPRANPRTE